VSLTQHCPGAKARGRVTWEGVSAAGVWAPALAPPPAPAGPGAPAFG
jgi:hypothetical protein